MAQVNSTDPKWNGQSPIEITRKFEPDPEGQFRALGKFLATRQPQEAPSENRGG